MVYLYYMLCSRYTILVGNPRYVGASFFQFKHGILQLLLDSTLWYKFQLSGPSFKVTEAHEGQNIYLFWLSKGDYDTRSSSSSRSSDGIQSPQWRWQCITGPPGYRTACRLGECGLARFPFWVARRWGRTAVDVLLSGYQYRSGTALYGRYGVWNMMQDILQCYDDYGSFDHFLFLLCYYFCVWKAPKYLLFSIHKCWKQAAGYWNF